MKLFSRRERAANEHSLTQEGFCTYSIAFAESEFREAVQALHHTWVFVAQDFSPKSKRRLQQRFGIVVTTNFHVGEPNRILDCRTNLWIIGKEAIDLPGCRIQSLDNRRTGSTPGAWIGRPQNIQQKLIDGARLCGLVLCSVTLTGNPH